jgi:hypothetical protein
MTSLHPLPAPCQWFPRLSSALDRRSAPRLALLSLVAVLARGRRTVTSWIRAAGLSDQFRPCYTAVAAAGKNAETIAAKLVLWIVKPLVIADRNRDILQSPERLGNLENALVAGSLGGSLIHERPRHPPDARSRPRSARLRPARPPGPIPDGRARSGRPGPQSATGGCRDRRARRSSLPSSRGRLSGRLGRKVPGRQRAGPRIQRQSGGP